ncbi:MAG: demethoxyubiquinone hydroxylase family protein [Pseudomonadales bacterium]
MNKPESLQQLHAGYHDQAWLLPELRSDHAGETGAVWIYRGILAITRDPGLREFSRRHLQTELEHLALMDQLVPPAKRSRLLVPWRIAGFLTGAMPAMFGPRMTFRVISSVETFVEAHYLAQVRRLRRDGQEALAALLARCLQDEVTHQQEAAFLAGDPHGGLDLCIDAVITRGSALAVAAARRF